MYHKTALYLNHFRRNNMYHKATLYLILMAFILAACGSPDTSSNEDAQLVSAEKTLAALEQQAASAQQSSPTDTPLPPPAHRAACARG